MADFSLNYSALGGGSEGLTAEERELLNRLEALQQALRWAAEGWSGEAATAFNLNMQVFSQELDKLRVVLGATGNALDTAGINYRAVDLRAAHRMG
ncbi:WXG100 family type VII secretion target [Streptomyces sp. SBT349]|uniref:WXG100 family type VII secretion target n=1 Tax=Streptomyces sp. SBT349 TaxID=1580539 RepID=UPI00066C246D|nr:WXG100 family type VII secretion target [Streptomyces sp. SBT349]